MISIETYKLAQHKKKKKYNESTNCKILRKWIFSESIMRMREKAQNTQHEGRKLLRNNIFFILKSKLIVM